MRQKSDLRGAQQRSVTRLYEYDGQQAVVPMGGGKTATALTTIREMIDDNIIKCGIILAPKKVCQLVWGPGREHAEWEHLASMNIQMVTGSPAQRLQRLLEPGFDLYVVGKDVTVWLVEQLEKLPPWHPLWGLLCIDEISAFKSPRGKRYKALKRVVERFGTIWGLTGTPRPNSYEEQYPLLKIVSKMKIWSERPNFDKWRMERFIPDNPYRLDISKWDVRPEWEERILADIGRWSFTVSEKDLPELDPVQSVYHWVDLPKKAMQLYKDMERELLAKDDDWSVLAANQAVSTGKLAQIANGFMYAEDGSTIRIHDEKTDMLADLIDGLNGQSSLIAYGFREDLRRIKELVPDIPWFGAGTTDKQTFQFEKDWNAGRAPLLALHPASAGHGLNLQFGGSQCIMYDMPWSAELFDQLIKRFHRPGQRFQCFVHYIFARGTVDEMKHDRVHNKISAQEAFRNYLERI